jgi:hypothetical protein
LQAKERMLTEVLEQLREEEACLSRAREAAGTTAPPATVQPLNSSGTTNEVHRGTEAVALQRLQEALLQASSSEDDDDDL